MSPSAREVAYGVIAAVSASDAYANLLLPARIAAARLSPADAGFATELTYGTLRLRGYYDAVIQIAAGRTIDRIDEPILDVLRLGAHQILSMRVAEHAAVDESVRQARRVGSRSATGFTNAVLREITRATPEEWRHRVLASARSDDERIALGSSHPTWVVRAFRDALRADGRADELEQLLAADNAAPRVSLTALPGFATVSELGEATRFSPVGAASAGGDPLGNPAVRAGRARVQDEGSALAALALSRARPVAPGERWLDLCAGPGGKAALLAAEAREAGATLVANEIVPARAGLVRQALAVFGDDAPVVMEMDGTTIGDREPAAYDRILLDAPCSGLGALRRRPEARWRKSPKDVGELTRLQAALLDSALRALAPGGVLAYVTCSPHVAETSAIVAGRHLLDTPAVLAQFGVELPERPSAQLWPHAHGTDAMFIQLITKEPA